MRDLTHIAVSSEWEVVIVASLAYPISSSLMSSFRFLEALLVLMIQLECWGFVQSFSWCFISGFRLLSLYLKTLNLHSFPLFLELIWWLLVFTLHMNWLSSCVLRGLWFFTPIAFLSPFKVVVLTFRTLPTALWEFEISLRFFQRTFLTRFIWRNAWCALWFRWSLSRVRLFVAVLDFITAGLLDWSWLVNLKIDPCHIFF